MRIKYLVCPIVALIFALFSLIILFPAEYIEKTEGKFNLESVDRLAFYVAKYYTLNDFRYSCGSEYYFGFFLSFSKGVLGVPEEKLSNQLEKGGRLAYFIASSYHFDSSFLAPNHEVEEFNKMLLTKCSAE
ncbi:hypothetical protein [Roseibium album]|uniref:Uncharacterized protein n=1 Tax=Roseibium album TaxID=311410 RepID=A0A0M6ZLI0_9HYPH|nr:hypothetical protein [Roseibium album]CTQ63072.1 hypothetical protein LA5094_05870 [Roseibium album]CTQ69369.1 hypothetical protein LA5096_02113 [Roseibium album]CTQ80646.1 hypothetical protein LA5095_05887 [Roseibium album]